MANRLKKLQVTSVDLCKQGANPEAYIELMKSAKGGENEMNENEVFAMIGKSVAFANSIEPDGEFVETLESMNKAMRESMDSIENDATIDDGEREEMVAKSKGEYEAAVAELFKAHGCNTKKAAGENDEDEGKPTDDEGETESDGEPKEDEGAEVEAPEEKESKPPVQKKPVKKERVKNNMDEPRNTEVNADVKKALDEVARLRKELEMRDMADVAKNYVCIGKSVEELAPKLYDMKKSGGTIYDDYVALLDERVADQQESSVFKEYGSNAVGGYASDLKKAVTEIRKSRSELSEAEAIVEAYKTNPNLNEYE